MTVAVCVKCGSIKHGALNDCRACGFRPETEIHLAYSLALTDHYFSLHVLREISGEMKRGAPRPSLPRQHCGGTARITFILVSCIPESRRIQRSLHSSRLTADPRDRAPACSTPLALSRLSQEAGFAETRNRSERIVWPPRARRSRSFPARSSGKARRLRSATRPPARNTGRVSGGLFRQPRRRSSQRPHRSCTACRCRRRRLRNNPLPRSAPVELATTMPAEAAGSGLPVCSRRRV